MGRPRKEQVEGVTETPVVLTHEAMGTFKNPDTGKWMVAVVKYNPLTGDAEVSETLPAGETRDFAIELFKLEAVKREIVG